MDLCRRLTAHGTGLLFFHTSTSCDEHMRSGQPFGSASFIKGRIPKFFSKYQRCNIVTLSLAVASFRVLDYRHRPHHIISHSCTDAPSSLHISHEMDFLHALYGLYLSTASHPGTFSDAEARAPSQDTDTGYRFFAHPTAALLDHSQLAHSPHFFTPLTPTSSSLH